MLIIIYIFGQSRSKTRHAPTLVVAAATENDDDGEDYNPGAVVVKEIAKAVVIHICSSKDDMAAHVRSIHTMRRGREVTQRITKQKQSAFFFACAGKKINHAEGFHGVIFALVFLYNCFVIFSRCSFWYGLLWAFRRFCVKGYRSRTRPRRPLRRGSPRKIFLFLI